MTDTLALTAAEPSKSGVSWAAIFAGAAVATSTSLILLAVGSGLGLASVSPWQGAGASAGAITVMAGVWLIIVQWAASIVGGYMAGRLRTRWIGTHTHEVFFRDTAHGFITWSVATLLVATLFAAASIGAVKATTQVAGKAADGPFAAAADTLFRSATADRGGLSAGRDEALRIVTADMAKGEVTAADQTYLRDLVAARAGITPDEAQHRVDVAVTEIKAAADAARKTASATAFFTALSMLIGAFIASVSAALGGKLRDEHP
jgi:hypothetical protein